MFYLLTYLLTLTLSWHLGELSRWNVWGKIFHKKYLREACLWGIFWGGEFRPRKSQGKV